MTVSYVLTLVGHAESTPLKSVHLEQVYQCLGQTGRIDWLAEEEACDIFIDSGLTAQAITQKVQEALEGQLIDVVCTLVENRRKKLLISDMDSTVINQECINEIADAMGLGSKISKITDSVIQGKINFPEALRKRLTLMKGMQEELLQSVYEQRITLKSGARTLVQTMSRHGAFCILVSGGFTYFTSRIAARLGFHEHVGNELTFKHGLLTGEVKSPILGRTAKRDILMKLCDEKKLTPSQVLAVGDGANDIKMIQAAGLGVAFHDTGDLCEQSSACIKHRDLTAILYIQGFHKSEFVLT